MSTINLFPYEKELIEFCKIVDISDAEIYGKNIPPWNKGLKNCQFPHRKGKNHTPETKKKMSKSTNQFGPKNPFYGKKHSPETKEKLRQIHLNIQAKKRLPKKL